MKKVKNYILAIIIVFTSFFVSIKGVSGTTQFTINNATYLNYLNFYNLEFSDNVIAQKYFQFFEMINWDLADIIRHQDSYISERMNNYLWYISFDRPVTYIHHRYYDSDDNNNYNFYLEDNNGIYNLGFTFNFYNYPDSLDSKFYYNFDMLDLRFTLNSFKEWFFTIEYNSNTDSFSVYRPSGSGDDTKNKIHSLGYSFSQAFGAFYQSNFYLQHNEDSASIPIEIYGSSLYPNFSDTLKSREERSFIGSEYFSNNLMMGAGEPWYPAYTYITGKKEFGEPYTNDYSKIYVYGNSQCVFTPKDELINDYANIHSNKTEKFYMKPIIPYQTKDNDFMLLFTFDNMEKVSDVIILSDEEITDAPYKRFSQLSLANKDGRTFTPLLDDRDDVVLVRLSYTPGSGNAGQTLFYNHNYWEGECSLLGQDINYTDEHGNPISVLPGGVEDNRDKPWYEPIGDAIVSIVEFFVDSITVISDLFSRLGSSIKNFGGRITSAISHIGTLFSPISFIGANITLFFDSIPPIVLNTFIAIFSISGLAIIIKILL